MVDLIDSVIGSVTLFTPSDPKKGFSDADLLNYYKLHTAMYSQKTSAKTDNGVVYDADAEYFGTYGKIYFIGIDGGSTFINNYVAPGDSDYIGQAAGLLLIGGGMDPAKKASTYLPTYILNGTDTMVERYREVNGTNAYAIKGGVETFYDESIPLHKVMVARDDKADLAPYVQDAFDNIFAISQHVNVIRSTSGLKSMIQNEVRAGRGFRDLKTFGSYLEAFADPVVKVKYLEQQLAYKNQEIEFLKKIVSLGREGSEA